MALRFLHFYSAPEPAPACVPAKPPRDGEPDLATQLESLYIAVWEAERWWRFEDRVDRAVRLSR